MAKRITKKAYLRELDKLAPPIRKAYLEWVAERIGVASVARVETLVAQGDIDGIIRELDISEASLSNVTEQVREAYKAGGTFEAPAAQITFNIRSNEAEAWLRNNSSKLVKGITESQREGVRVVLENGMRTGNNPRTTALEIVGRVGPDGKRSGGIVGLTENQATYVTNARTQLRSGDPVEMREYLTRKARDKRYDAMVRRAIREGRTLSAKEVDRITRGYSNKLLKLRGDTIARTESIGSMNAGRDQTWHQAISEGKVLPEYITATWSSTGDARTRETHSAMNRQRRPQGIPFNSPSGALLMYPGDTSLGAGPEEVINCRCFLQKEVDFIAQAAAQQRAA